MTVAVGRLPVDAYDRLVTSFIPPQRSVVDPSSVIDREWIVTNGIGGYASGTIAGVLTRRYHGLLVAALDPPLGRTVLVAKLDDSVSFGGDPIPLFANQWGDGPSPIEAEGFRGLDALDDNLYAAKVEATLEPGESVRLVLTTDPDPAIDGEEARQSRERYEADLIGTASVDGEPWLRGIGPKIGIQTGWTGLVATLLQDQGEKR